MRRTEFIMQRVLICILVLSLIMPYGAAAETGSASSKLFSKEQLAQMLAPIALYPDSLLAQVLMASTYPLEVVQADRWMQENRNLKGDALDKQLLDKTWDISVKSLCHFPDVLAEMSKNLDRTAKLGDAFLAQQQEVMDTVQELRRKAQQAGNLKSTKEQTVVVEKETIVIQPATSSVVYVPAYNPTVVYGSWWYPSYPPYSYAYPWYPGAGAFAFGAGFAVGAAVSSWSNCNWNNGSITVNNNITKNFNRNANVSSARQNWQHNPQHRQGVAYRDPSTSKRFGQSSGSSMQGRQDSRGYGDRATQQPRDSRQQGIGDRGGMDRGGGRDAFQQRGAGASQRDSAFSGMGSGSRERMSSDRGRSSRESFQRSSGGFSGGSRSGGFSGGSRGGGGGGRGGGRR